VIDKPTIDRIVNFARWARTPRGAALATCYSAEGRYRPEMLRGDEAVDRSAPKPEPVDVRDALLVWRAINPTQGFPVRWYMAISARFIWRLQGYEFAGYMRRHKVPVTRNEDEHDRLVYQALSAARNVIERADVAHARRLRYSPAVPTGHGHHPLERVSSSDLQRVA
jgi:hypothetical protein